MIAQTCKVDMVPGGMPPIIHVSQYDAGSRDLTFELYSGAMPWKVPSGATVTIDGTKPDRKAFSVTATASGSTVTATVTQQMTAAAGRAECQLTVTSGENVLGSANFILDVERAAMSENADMSATDIASVEAAKTQAIAAAQAAQAAQAAAEAATSSKADKTAPTATKNVALLDANGNLMDSGKQLTPAAIGAMPENAGLWGFTAIPENADLNDYTACGYYRVSDNSTVSTLSNCPVSKSFTMQVSNAIGKTDSGAITGTTWHYRIQRVTDYETKEYVRLVYTNGSGTLTFSTWKKMLTDGDWATLKAEITPAAIGASTDGAGLWGNTQIPEGADLNDYTACGYYGHTSGAVTNNPSASNIFSLKVYNSCGWYGDHDAISGKTWRYRTQKLTDLWGNEFTRHAETNGSGTVSFGDWKKTLYADSALPALGISTGSWTPTVSGAGSYSVQQGQYIKIGNMAVVTFAVYGTFSGSTTERISVSGCPLTAANSNYSGGGHLSGYTAAANIVFSGWQTNVNGGIYAVGQQTGTDGANKFGSNAIYQKASGDFSAGGTVAFRVG